MEFFYDYEGLTIKMEYWKKDFTATYDSPYGPIKFGSHIMAMCPWIFTEDQIKNEKSRLAGKYFVSIKKFLDENPDFIENSKTLILSKNNPIIGNPRKFAFTHLCVRLSFDKMASSILRKTFYPYYWIIFR